MKHCALKGRNEESAAAAGGRHAVLRKRNVHDKQSRGGKVHRNACSIISSPTQVPVRSKPCSHDDARGEMLRS